MINIDSLEYKEWDSAFFKQDIYAIDHNHLLRLSDEELFIALKGGIIQIKIEASSIDSIDKLQKLGFSFVESEVSFSKKVSELSHSIDDRIQPALCCDIDEIQAMAAKAFTQSRFRYPWFKKTDSSRFYAEWAKKAVLHQYDDLCLKIVSSSDNTISGIITAKLLGSNKARIGLICVSEGAQGKNLGAALLNAVEDYVRVHGVKKIQVATQGSNQRACSFYLRNNYQLDAINYWFYKRLSV